MNQSDTPTKVPLDGAVRPSSEARWCVEERDTGMPVAQGYAPTKDQAIQEATHYAVQYAQDHPVRWWVRQNRKTIVKGSIGHVTILRTVKA